MKKYRINGDRNDIKCQEIDGLATTERMYEITGEDIHCSDGYHSMDELYDHRIMLYIALCRLQASGNQCDDFNLHSVWRSKRHSDGELCFGTGTQFVLGIDRQPGKQITYHIPIERWEETDFAQTLDKAPEWDGHTSNDVLQRLNSL